eukprot:Amastigsp_a3274_27.p3 type:complete len:183 gc:universal Amastigsp_a3274_27:943-395(-)
MPITSMRSSWMTAPWQNPAAAATTWSGSKCSSRGWLSRACGASRCHSTSRSSLSAGLSESSAMTPLSQSRNSRACFLFERPCVADPEPISSTPSAASGASARPIATCSCGESDERTDSSSTGMLASGYMSSSGMNAPWSSPRFRSTPASMPAAASSSRTRSATAGAPGGRKSSSYVWRGNPP